MIDINYKSGITLASKGEGFNIKEVNINKQDKTITGVLISWKDKYIVNYFLIKKVKIDGKEKWEIELENNALILNHVNLEMLIRHKLIDFGYDIDF